MQVTKEQVEQAKNVDLVDYLMSKGYEVGKTGNGYKIKVRNKFPGDLSSLSIFENRHGWKRWSNGTHGGDAISFLQNVMDLNFQEAVLELSGGQAMYTSAKAIHNSNNNSIAQEKHLILPESANVHSRVYIYLNRERMIDDNIIRQMVADKKIYQDIRNNAVFVGLDEKQEPKFACIRGTNINIPYKGDCDGSDKRYAFSIEGMNKSKLYVFEAPIDLLSHATMANHITNNPNAWKMHTRISLSGTSDVALEHFLRSHPDIKEIHFVLDNDVPGQTAAKKHCEKYSSLGYKTVNHVLKTNDMNEELIAYITKPLPVQNNQSMKR